MLKKVLVGTGIAAALTCMFLLGSLTIGPVFAQTQTDNALTQVVSQSSNNGSTEDKMQGPDLDNVDQQVGNQTQIDKGQTGNDETDVTNAEKMPGQETTEN